MGFSHDPRVYTSVEWRHMTSPVKVKAKRTISTRNVVASVSWNRHVVLLVKFMQQGRTINAAAYCSTQTKIRRIIQNKRRGLLTSGLLLPDHNLLFTSKIWSYILNRNRDHPSYSPACCRAIFSCSAT